MRGTTVARPTFTMLLPNYARTSRPWDDLLVKARVADEVGVDRLVFVDHVVLGAHTDRYERGPFLTGPEGQWLEPLTTMAVVAGRTDHIRLSAGVIIAALRRPVVFAKAAATLDVLSGGRLDLGVGTGWQREEYEAAGLRFEDRGRLLDLTLELCRRLWADGPASYEDDDGNGLRFTDIWCEPKPVQTGGVPVWIAGRLSRPVLERIVRYGDGWIPWAEWADDVERGVDVIRAAFDDAGRDWLGFDVRSVLAVRRHDDGSLDVAATVDNVPALVAAGVTDFSIQGQLTALDVDQLRDELAALVHGFRAAVGRV